MSEPLNAITDPESGIRQYIWKGQALTSVTSMRRMAGVPFHLANWQVNQAIDAVLDDPTIVQEALSVVPSKKRKPETPDEYAVRLRKEQRKVIRSRSEMKRNEAADLGTQVHEAAEQGLRAIGLDQNDSRRPFLQQYETWEAFFNPKVLLQECQVFNLTEGYAGSVDMVAAVDGHTYVVDIKTGSGLYPDHAIQLTLYAMAEFVGGYDPVLDDDVIDESGTQVLKSIDRAAILHLRPDHWEWVEVPLSTAVREASLSMVRFARWLIDNPAMDDIIRKGIQTP
jgi:hypothetical protein